MTSMRGSAAIALTLLVLGVPHPARAGDLLVSGRHSGQIARYDGTTGAFIGSFTATGGPSSAPAGLAFGSDAALYVASGGADVVGRYDERTGTSLGPFAGTGLDQPSGLAFGPDGHLYVASRADHRVVRFHGVTGALLGTFVAAGSGGLIEPSSLAFGPDGHLYVSSFGSDNILRYDGVTGAFIGAFAAGGGLDGPEGLAFGADGRLYVASSLNHRVVCYSGTTGALVGTFVVAGSGGLASPVGLGFGPDGHLYVSSLGTDQVLRYHKSTGAFLGVFVSTAAGGLDGPAALVFDPVKVVDAAGGGDYTSIQAAVNDLPNPGPRIVKVRAGTYREAVLISRRNTTAVAEGQRIVLTADPDAAPGTVVITPPTERNAVTIDQSRFVTVRGFTLTGATREAIMVRAALSRDVTVDGNDVHHNGSAQASGGIYIGRDNPRVWVVNNLIRENGRNGVFAECGVQSAPKYFVNNTVVRNGFNGFFVGDAMKDEAFLVNNLIAGNGTAPGVTGGRFGVFRESAAPATGPGFRTTVYLRNNMFYGNAGGDIGNVVQTLDAADDDNRTTTGSEAAKCLGGAGSCPTAIAGCTFADCRADHALDDIFADPATGDYRLAATSPAIGAGLASFVGAGAERVPAVDLDGHPRPVAAPPAAGAFETP